MTFSHAFPSKASMGGSQCVHHKFALVGREFADVLTCAPTPKQLFSTRC